MSGAYEPFISRPRFRTYSSELARLETAKAVQDNSGRSTSCLRTLPARSRGIFAGRREEKSVISFAASVGAAATRNRPCARAASRRFFEPYWPPMIRALGAPSGQAPESYRASEVGRHQGQSDRDGRWRYGRIQSCRAP
jgi:hypothetical protein